jgi:hypothetical protein
MDGLFSMGLGPWIVILIRLLVPWLALRWQFWGAVIAVLCDVLDVVFVTILGMGDFSNYSAIDKALDWYMFGVFAIVSLRWEKLARNTYLALFGWRTIGVVLFEITQIRWLLLIFPNLVEFWYFAWAVRNKWMPHFELTKKRLFIILGILLIPKMAQEYFLHYMKAQPWNWLKANLFGLGKT